MRQITLVVIAKPHYFRLLRLFGSVCPPPETDDLNAVLLDFPLESDEDRELFDALPSADNFLGDPVSDDPVLEETFDENDIEEEYSDSDEEFENPTSTFSLKNANEDALDELRCLVFLCGFTVKATHLLLKFLLKHSNLLLPKTYRTLMRTPQRSVVPIPVGPRGQYVHIGIRHFFLNTKLDKIFALREIILNIGIDGISFFNSSKLQGWPIIGRIHGLEGVPPFLIGIYTGVGKPESFDEFLAAFCDEIDIIEREGGVMVNGKRIKLSIRAFICDTPARSYDTNTHHHNHHNGCHKCVQPTEFINGARFYSKIVGEKRTDLSFIH